MMNTVAVITSTIGRPHLEEAILSVQTQTYPCKHYVFVDGERFWPEAKQILDKYPDVIATYLPMNTGADGWTNSYINAMAPFLVKEDVLCFLDDDNWYTPNHVEQCIKALQQTPSASYAFALRNLYLARDWFVCPDNLESIGPYQNRLPNPFHYELQINGQHLPMYTNQHYQYHIDTNCFAIKRTLARQLAHHWTHSKKNDYIIANTLRQSNETGVCTKSFTVNYVIDLAKYDSGFIQTLENLLPMEKILEAYALVLKNKHDLNLQLHGNQYPWDTLPSQS